MAVDPVSSSSTLYSRDTSKDKPESAVDTEMFLKLLVAQLKYQDPLEPQKDTAFVTQLAQMTTLQEMQQMNASIQNTQAYDMIGKEIYAEVLNKDTGVTHGYFGLVESVVIKDGIPYAVVGNQAINLSDIKQVFAPGEPVPEENVPEETSDPATDETPNEDPSDTTTETEGVT